MQALFNLPLSQGQLDRLRPLGVCRTKTELQSLTDENQTRCGSVLCAFEQLIFLYLDFTSFTI